MQLVYKDHTTDTTRRWLPPLRDKPATSTPVSPAIAGTPISVETAKLVAPKHEHHFGTPYFTDERRVTTPLRPPLPNAIGRAMSWPILNFALIRTLDLRLYDASTGASERHEQILTRAVTGSSPSMVCYLTMPPAIRRNALMPPGCHQPFHSSLSSSSADRRQAFAASCFRCSAVTRHFDTLFNLLTRRQRHDASYESESHFPATDANANDYFRHW